MRFSAFVRSTVSIGALIITASPALAQDASQSPDEGEPLTEAQDTPADNTEIQQEADAQDQEIVVTGIRASLRSAQNLRRNSDQIVDAIVAEDIGKLPDLAVSDTAARIPGVQVVRTGGEASNVLIRGLPDFTTTYNGREIFTAESRSVALQDFPSANIAALEVFKTTTANLVEAGLAGLVNVRSRRPFDFSGLEIAGSVWGLFTRQAGEITPNGNLLISNRWDTGIGEIGVLVNASYTQLRFLDSEPSNTDFIADPVINGQRVRFPDVQRLFYREGDRTRPSVNIALQWRPNDKLEFYVDGLYQGFRNKISDRRLDALLFGGQSYSNLVFREGTNLLESGTVTNPGDALFSFQGGTFNQTDTYQFAIGGRYESGPFQLAVDLARTDTEFNGSTESVDRRYCQNGYTVDFDLRTPEFTVRGCDLNNPANQLFEGLYEEAQVARGDDYQARIDAEYEFPDESFIRSVEIGLRYTTRDSYREFGNRFGGFGRPRRFPINLLPLEFEVPRAGFRGTDVQSGTRTFLVPTYQSIRDNRAALRQFVINNVPDFGFPANGRAFTTDAPAPNANSIYNADEETLAGYAQLNYRFGEAIDGTIGLRAVKTDAQVSGVALVQGQPTPITADYEYTDYLPNANLRWRLSPQWQARLSYTQTRTRPSFRQLNPSVDVGPQDPTRNNLRTGRGGNPNLRPVESDNYDASIEYYFSRTGFATLSVFRRDIAGFIQDEERTFQDPVLGLVQITGPINTRSATLRGLEAQISTFFEASWVPEFLHNFGIQANYTYIDGKVEIQDPVTKAFFFDRITAPEGEFDFGGVSEHTFNVALLYENGPLSARATWNKRSEYLDRRSIRVAPQDAGPEQGNFYREEATPPNRFDLSLNYRFNDNFTIFADATNIGGEPFRVDFSSARAGAPRADYVRYLRYDETTLSLGVRFRL